MDNYRRYARFSFPKPERKGVALNLEVSMLEDLDIYAKRQGITRTAAIRRAIEKLIYNLEQFQTQEVNDDDIDIPV